MSLPTSTSLFPFLSTSTITTGAQPTSTDDIDTGTPPITTLRDFKIGIIVGVIFLFLLLAGVTVLLVWRWKWHKREVVYAESLRSYTRVPGSTGGDKSSGKGRATRFMGSMGILRKEGRAGEGGREKGDKFATAGGGGEGIVVGVSEYDREYELERGHALAGRG